MFIITVTWLSQKTDLSIFRLLHVGHFMRMHIPSCNGNCRVRYTDILHEYIHSLNEYLQSNNEWQHNQEMVVQSSHCPVFRTDASVALIPYLPTIQSFDCLEYARTDWEGLVHFYDMNDVVQCLPRVDNTFHFVNIWNSRT